MRKSGPFGRPGKAVPILLLALGLIGCGGSDGTPADTGPKEITIYSGRSEKLIGPFLKAFEAATNIRPNVRYGDTAELAAQIIEEGANSPADVFFGQDAGALGALQAKIRLASLDQSILDRVPATFRSTQGKWVGTSGRVRVVAFNPTLVKEADLPDAVAGLTDPRWKGKVGWAPRNGSFQSFVTAYRKIHGEDAAKKWLSDMKANGARVYENNDAVAEAIAKGEIPLGLVNHYYPFEVREEIPDANIRDHFFSKGDVGGLVNVAGAGILTSSKRKADATRFIEYLLSEAGQRYFVEKTFEYPLVAGIKQHADLPALDTLGAPAVDLSDLADLEGTLKLLQTVGLT